MKIQWVQLSMTVIFLAFTLWPEAVTDGLLSMNARNLSAAVTANGLMHNTCEYAYSLDGHAFSGKGYDCGRYGIGDAIEIYYSPVFKGVSSNRKPGSEYPVGLAVSAVVLPFAAFFRKRRRTAA